MPFDIITESNVPIGPFDTPADAVKKAAALGLGHERDYERDDERAGGWHLRVAVPTV